MDENKLQSNEQDRQARVLEQSQKMETTYRCVRSNIRLQALFSGSLIFLFELRQ